MFIAIYGVNNIGKSTQAKLLVEKLNAEGKNAVHRKYPLYDVAPTGSQINYYLRDAQAPKISPEELQMWYALNRFQGEPELKKLLDDDIVVVAEDYTGTGIAWGMTHGADKKWLQEINKHLLKEEMAILLDGDQFLTERETQHLNEDKDDLITRCRAIHLELSNEYGWHIVNANRAVTAVAEDIWKIIH